MPAQQAEGLEPRKSKANIKPKVLFSWQPTVRPFKKRGKDFYTSLIAILTLLSFIVFIIEGWLPVVLIIALGFLFYVLSTVEPTSIEAKITDQGIMINESVTAWELITRYWLTSRLGSELLVLETLNLPGRIELVIQTKDKNKITDHLNKFISQENRPPTYFDRASSWLDSRQGK